MVAFDAFIYTPPLGIQGMPKEVGRPDRRFITLITTMIYEWMAGSGSSVGLPAEVRARTLRVEDIQKARINRSTYGPNWSYYWRYPEQCGGITEEKTSLECL